MGMMEYGIEEYGESLTKQTFKDECDVNKILDRFARTGAISHLEQRGAEYGDFSDVTDLEDAYARIKRGEQIFSELPSELRNEFQNNPWAFFRYVNDPRNEGRLKELLPKIAEAGRVMPAVRRGPASEANPALASSPAEPAIETPAEPAAPATAEPDAT